MTDRAVGADSKAQEETTGRKVILLLLLAGAAGVAAFGFLGFSPNRILSAKPIYLWQASPGLTAVGIGLGAALIAAARDAGIRITLLDTCYLAGGIGRPLEGVQLRFGDGDAATWAGRVDTLG